mgnify:FL=1
MSDEAHTAAFCMSVMKKHVLRAHAPGWVRVVRRPWVRTASFLGLRILPRGRQIVFVSVHPDDPDALVILEYLARHSSRPLVWLGVDELPADELLDPLARSRVTLGRLHSVAGAYSLLTSSLVFHTHGIFGIRRATGRQVVINVWHGDGPKVMRPDPIATTFMVTGVQAFGLRRMAVLGLPAERLLTTGRPRVDDIHRPPHAAEQSASMRALGLDDRPVVWWLPTWRESASGPVALGQSFEEWFTPDAFARVRDRYQFVVKPHPNSPPQAWPEPWRVLTASEITRAKVRWYRVLASAAAIITDYSSVWSDFLESSVPLAFIVPDAEDYARERGFYMEDWRRLLPGPLLAGPGELHDFLAGLAERDHQPRRIAVAHALGSNNGAGATQRLLTALSEHDVEWR